MLNKAAFLLNSIDQSNSIFYLLTKLMWAISSVLVSYTTTCIGLYLMLPLTIVVAVTYAHVDSCNIYDVLTLAPFPEI